jgi:hypothetical protein
MDSVNTWVLGSSPRLLAPWSTTRRSARRCGVSYGRAKDRGRRQATALSEYEGLRGRGHINGTGDELGGRLSLVRGEWASSKAHDLISSPSVGRTSFLSWDKQGRLERSALFDALVLGHDRQRLRHVLAHVVEEAVLE